MADTPILDTDGKETILVEDQIKLFLGLDTEDDLDLDEEQFPGLFPTRVMQDGNGTEQRGDLPRTFVLE